MEQPLSAAGKAAARNDEDLEGKSTEKSRL
jgi:hypothetical protein